MRKYWKVILVSILGVHALLLTALKFTAWPEMLLWPYLLGNGWSPYTNIAIAHTPFLLLKLTIFFKLFGVGIIQLKIFTWLLVLLTDGILFWIVKKLWNLKSAIFALLSFVAFQLFFDGNGLWFDLFMGLVALVSFYFVQKKSWIWAGVFWGLAVISKQTAVYFAIPVVFALINDSGQFISGLKRFILGSAFIFIPFVLILQFFEILPGFYKWAINFGIFILPKAQGQVHLPDLRNFAVALFPFLVFLPFLLNQKGKKLSAKISLALWAIAGSLGAFPRFEYFHFQPAIPYLAIAAGMVFSDFKKTKGIWKTFLVIYLIGIFILFAGFFMRNWREGTRFYERDVQEVTAYIKNNTDANDKIFVLNWWDNIYALSDRLPSTNPWVPQLSWYTETPGVQDRMVADLMISPPRLIIFYSYTETGLSSYVPPKVFDYINSKYSLKEIVAGVQILEPTITK